jgi:NTP pyrophosphatase (non-canonical NTP hydrolase)
VDEGMLVLVTKGLMRRFPAGNEPYRIMTRLLEECGELAQQVNHFENSGVKQEKYGRPDKAKLAKEVMDVLRAALQIAIYYEIEAVLDDSIQKSYQLMIQEGLLTDSEVI